MGGRGRRGGREERWRGRQAGEEEGSAPLAAAAAGPASAAPGSPAAAAGGREAPRGRGLANSSVLGRGGACPAPPGPLRPPSSLQLRSPPPRMRLSGWPGPSPGPARPKPGVGRGRRREAEGRAQRPALCQPQLLTRAACGSGVAGSGAAESGGSATPSPPRNFPERRAGEEAKVWRRSRGRARARAGGVGTGAGWRRDVAGARLRGRPQRLLRPQRLTGKARRAALLPRRGDPASARSRAAPAPEPCEGFRTARARTG